MRRVSSVAVRIAVSLVLVLVSGTSCNTPTTPNNSAPNVPPVYQGRPVEVQGTLYVSSRDIEINVWDGGNFVDNDIITLVVNDKVVLSNYSLRGPAAKRAIQGQLDFEGYNYVLLYAHNEGRVRPNTASMSIDDGRSAQNLVINANLSTCGAYNVVLQ